MTVLVVAVCVVVWVAVAHWLVVAERRRREARAVYYTRLMMTESLRCVSREIVALLPAFEQLIPAVRAAGESFAEFAKAFEQPRAET